MQFVDFFAGIGGIRLGLEQAGHKCVGFCEFDKYARTAYKAMYDTEGEWENHDVRTVKPYDVPAADLWCFGFPCQDISVAGKQKGLQEGERSGLFYEIMRLLAGRRKDSNYLYEVEVKISIADFRKDRKKEKYHDHPDVKGLYYFVPNELYSKHEDEIKTTCKEKGAGLIVDGYPITTILKPRVRKEVKPLTDNGYIHYLRLFAKKWVRQR